jgi:hypothetical protein
MWDANTDIKANGRKEMKFVDCFYYGNIEEFDGCSALDYGCDTEDCGNCPYRLGNLLARVKKYDELIFAVESKFPKESRHETALRYIKEGEQNTTLDSPKFTRST